MGTKKAQLSFVKWVIQATLISVLVVGILMAIVCGAFVSSRTNADYIEMAETASTHIAAQLNVMSDGDYHYDQVTGKIYKGDIEITDEAFWAIHKENEEIHHTLFWGDTRILTDIADANGKTVVGSKLKDQTIINSIEKNGKYAANNVEIYGTKYSVCYTPIKNNGKTVGLVFVGVNQEEANGIIIKDILLAALLTIVMAGVVIAVITFRIRKKAKTFGINLNEAAVIAEEKKNSVTELGVTTKDDMGQINMAIDQVSLAVTEQASQTEEIMGSMQEFGTSIDIIMSQVDNTSDVASDSIGMIEELRNQLNALEQVSIENSRGIANIAKQVEQDGAAVANISKIIDVINSIAFQITILSFNASVEAARAGEAGKGFAVVADSIKDLSDKTKDSLEEITRIVLAVNEEMNETIASSEQLIKENDKVVDALNVTKERMDGVADSFDKIVDNIKQIKNESGAIIESKNQVVERVSSLAATSEENAAMSQEMKASADEVIHTTKRLLDEIKRLQEINKIIDHVMVLFSDQKAIQ